VSAAPVIFSAVPTLFGPGGELDLDANRALHKFVAGLVDGLFVAGTTGEFPALEDAERLSLLELALTEAGSDRVIAHVGAPDARHAGRLAQAAVALGATRIAAITPYYLPARPDELIAHYRAIRDAAPGAELYAYIFPERTGLPVSATLFARVAEAAGLAGAKISGSAAGELAGYVAAAPGLRFFSGDDANPAATMRAGGAGVISGRSSAYPEVYAALHHQPRAKQTLEAIVALGTSVGRLKHALRLRGFGSGTARMTVDPPDLQAGAAIAAQVAAAKMYTGSGVNPDREWRVVLCRGPAQAGRRTSNKLGRRLTGPRRALRGRGQPARGPRDRPGRSPHLPSGAAGSGH
jgi:4-hydroxy-tetrahydrodipicolinate synthase